MAKKKAKPKSVTLVFRGKAAEKVLAALSKPRQSRAEPPKHNPNGCGCSSNSELYGSMHDEGCDHLMGDF